MVWKLLCVVIRSLNLTRAVYLETYLYRYSAEQEPPRRKKKKHLSTFQIYACNYFNSFTQIVNIESEITQQILELLDFFTVKRLNLALTA